MKVLFKCSWKDEDDSKKTARTVEDYCRSLAKHLASSQHKLILTSASGRYDRLVADEIVRISKKSARSTKDCLIYLLPEPIEEIPSEGTVIPFEQSRWRIEERTFQVQQSDAVIAIGGGKGTFDSIQKAFFLGKKVFVASAVPGGAKKAWKQRPEAYCYRKEHDADFIDDVATTPDQFFQRVFELLDLLGEHSRKIFIVHGRDHFARNSLEAILEKLKFEPVVLEKQASNSLAVIEKLERDTRKVGFGFVVYTPDDLGRLKGDDEKPRARQNVVFEHGLLMGLIGRDRTCALIQGDVEIPSDLTGVIYERFNVLEQDALKIASILKQAGYAVDASLLL